MLQFDKYPNVKYLTCAVFEWSVLRHYFCKLQVKLLFMKDRKSVFLTTVILLFSAAIQAQVIAHPNCGMIIPNTLVIDRIETANGTSVFYFSVENQIKDGYFCADKNIYLIYPDGSRSKLKKAEGIPVCPAMYKFKTVGERLDFRLLFPAIKENIQWIDLVEECSSDCMFFYGLTLDKQLNTRLDELFLKAEKATPVESTGLFKSMIDEIDNKNLGIEGSLYINVINESLAAGDTIGASAWYKRMLTSGAPRLSYYIKFLNDKGVRF
jgi:hypothetical protein